MPPDQRVREMLDDDASCDDDDDYTPVDDDDYCELMEDTGTPERHAVARNKETTR